MKYLMILIILSFTLYACINNGQAANNISLVDTYQLGSIETSGLSFNNNFEKLLMVSDNSGNVYRTEIDGTADTNQYIYEGDLEGITIFNDSNFAVVSERERKILLFDEHFNLYKVISTGITGKENNGFEGIAFIPNQNVFLVANEKNPVAIYKISLDGDILSENFITFASDISGLFYDSTNDYIWILSEEESSVFKCNSNFKIISTYKVADEKLEGIVVNNNTMFLVSDKSNKLYKYKILE